MARRSSLFVDRLVTTIPVPHSDRYAVVERIPDTTHPLWRIVHSSRTQLYRTNFRLALASDATLLHRQFDTLDAAYEQRPATQLGHVAYISCEPGRLRQRFLRVEYSPHAAGPGGRAHLRQFLELLLANGYQQAINEASITRLDIGFDVTRQQLRDLAITFRQGRKTRGTRVFTGGDGEIESIYDPASGTRQLVVYDKTRDKNRLARKAAQESLDRYVPRATSQTRFEYRWRKMSLSWQELLALGNPFARYQVREFQRNEVLLDSATERFYFDAAASRNEERLLHSFEANSQRATSAMRTLLRGAYARCPIPVWWEPSQIWGELPTAIRDIGLLPCTRT